MSVLNERRTIILLTEILGGSEGAGGQKGAELYPRLVAWIDANRDKSVVRISMKGVKKFDASCAAQSVIEVIRRFKCERPICLVDLSDADIRFNIDVAAERMRQPVTIWDGVNIDIVGTKPSGGNRAALAFALSRKSARAADFAESVEKMSIANASTKFKQLWEQGFLMRSESAAESGGVEYIYERIG